MRVLVVNAGSSTLKLAVIEGDDEPARTAVIEGGDTQDRASLAAFVRAAGALDGVGHRVVHGGPRYTAPTPITPGVRADLDDLVPLAPLHQPRALAAIDEVTALLPDVPAVACFDTAFHATIPPPAHTYAVPEVWRDRWPVRRFGFHGLSHAWAARQAGPGRVVTCHLGSGSSLCAVHDGRSIDTTMGFTPLEGLVMATRSGTVDPGLVLWLLEHGGLAPAEVRAGLEADGGLKGLAGGTGDMRAVLAATGEGGEGKAARAYDVWRHRVRRELGAMVMVLGGVDTVVFTGGIGEHAPRVRADVAAALSWLGARIDHARNADLDDTGGEVSAPGSAVRLLVVPAREDVEIARQVRATLPAPPRSDTAP